MRRGFSDQTRLDCQSIPDVQLNLNCRDEIIPILAGLRYVYSQPQLRNEILDLVAQDVNKDSRSDTGREGLDYWHITVLAAVRLGCNLDFDKLQDLAEQHRALRQVMGIGKTVPTSMPDALGTTFVCSKHERSKLSAIGSSRKLTAWCPKQ